MGERNPSLAIASAILRPMEYTTSPGLLTDRAFAMTLALNPPQSDELEAMAMITAGAPVSTEEALSSALLRNPVRANAPGSVSSPVVIEIPEALYRKVAYRESTEGIIAEVEYKERTLSDLRLPENPLIIVLESVEKPGNLGAVLRSADAAGVDAVIISDPLTDLYNPNLIRASIGAVFTVPTVACGSEEAIGFLEERNIQILTAQLQDSSLYYDVDMRRGTALVMGTESTGLTDQWREAASAHICIPMLGRLDSLNVSVSAAILLFEAVRQRQN